MDKQAKLKHWDAIRRDYYQEHFSNQCEITEHKLSRLNTLLESHQKVLQQSPKHIDRAAILYEIKSIQNMIDKILEEQFQKQLKWF